MSLISLQNVDFDYGREPILRGASLTLLEGERYALIGQNGAGKSTLLNLIAGELEAHGGERQAAGGVRVRLLRQSSSLTAGQGAAPTVYDTVAASAFARELDLEAALARLADELAAAAPARALAIAHEQGRLQADYEHRDGYTWRARLEQALAGLGLPQEAWRRDPGVLSGGERRRAALAAALLDDAQVLLLDEPTNHLDLDACEWLEQRLLRRPGAVLVVSHDRWFLDRVATRTVHLHRAKLTSWTGNYTTWLRASAEQRQRDEAAWRRQQERIEKTEDFIRRNLAGQKTKQAQSRRRQLAREERVERPAAGPASYRIELVPERESGVTAFEATGLSKTYGAAPLFQDLDLRVARGERLGVVGPNGCGKSTLLKILAGSVIPERGRVVVGHNVDLGLYDQHLGNVTDRNTVLEELASVWPAATQGELRSFAGAFGFGADMIDRPVGRLSGGERGRLSLMRLIKEGHNTLLLDEPTNHLDIGGREALEEALQEFTGTLVVVTHDRSFLDRIARRLLVFGRDGAGKATTAQFAGGWSEYVARREEAAAAALARATQIKAAAEASAAGRNAAARAAAPAPAARADGPLSKNEIRRRQEWIAEAEAQIAALEQEKERLLAEMADPGTTPEARVAASQRIVEAEGEIEGLMGKWEEWSREIT